MPLAWISSPRSTRPVWLTTPSAGLTTETGEASTGRALGTSARVKKSLNER